jgi:hypothetical protein
MRRLSGAFRRIWIRSVHYWFEEFWPTVWTLEYVSRERTPRRLDRKRNGSSLWDFDDDEEEMDLGIAIYFLGSGSFEMHGHSRNHLRMRRWRSWSLRLPMNHICVE